MSSCLFGIEAEILSLYGRVASVLVLPGLDTKRPRY